MKPSAYFRELVEPAIDAFAAEPESVWRAYSACLFAYHFADAVGMHTENTGGGPTRLDAVKELAVLSPAFEIVQGVATMAKHIEVKSSNIPMRPKMLDTHIGPESGFTDGTFFTDGTSFSDARDVVRTRDVSGRPVDVLWCVSEARSAIKGYLSTNPGL